MSRLQANGVDIHYEICGAGPWITFSHALAADLHLWDAQVEALSRDFTLLRYDIRGHGLSSAPAGPYRIEDLAGDVLALWDALGVERSHFVGLSMGGMIGQAVALQAAERLQCLVLCSTAGSYAANRQAIGRLWDQRIAEVAEHGMAAVAEATLARWFTEPYRCEAPAVMARIAQAIAATSPEAYAACGRMVASFDALPRLGRVALPTLVLVGEDDAGTPPAMARSLAEAIPRARLEVFPQASHCLNIEQASLFNLLLQTFLSSQA